MRRGRCLLSGRLWGVHRVALDRVADVDLGAGRAADLGALDAAWPTLADDERLLFLWGYERSLGGSSGIYPDAFAWRCRVVDDAPTTTATSTTLTLTTTAQERERHIDRVTRCRELLLDGVLYQANLAHRLTVAQQSHDEGLAFFLASPARDLGCSAFVDIATDVGGGRGFGSLVSLSPERFIEADLKAGVATTFPIKGTVPRSADPATLLASSKDQAEHVMIVDLLRNDLGKVAVTGGVTVERLMEIVTTPSVHHMETTVSARLRAGTGIADLLAACAPGGSITGAPKSSATEVIAELEDAPRGPYTGVLGVVDNRGQLRSSLLIRTWLRSDHGDGALHVGGGIVVDSDPETEWQETLHKARAFGAVTVR